jgi:CDP-6-deoxy-D-xylo-4-hexulose-3-dehydrase
MIWPLQENLVSPDEFKIAADYLLAAKRVTQNVKVREFEEAYSRWQGCPYSVFVNSGSSANLLLVAAALELYGWPREAEVLVPAVTWPTTVTPVVQLGLRPVFVDANLQDLSVDYDDLASKITPNTRAVFLAHILGFPGDTHKIKEIIADRPIALLEDSCESLGATVHGSKVGNSGLGSTFSFYWGHHMTTIEGGMVCTHNEELYHLLLLKRSHGLARELPVARHAEIRAAHPDNNFNFLFLSDGYNVRSTELNAVLGLEQLKRIDSVIARRNSNYELFARIMHKYSRHFIVPERDGYSSFALPLLCRIFAIKRHLEAYLAEMGIETRPLVGGNLLRQPFLKYLSTGQHLPNADFLHTNAFYIGNNQFVDEQRLEVLSSALEKFFDEIERCRRMEGAWAHSLNQGH